MFIVYSNDTTFKEVPLNGIGRENTMKKFLYALMVVFGSFFLVMGTGVDEQEAIKIIPDYKPE
jgi:hypothetical protein